MVVYDYDQLYGQNFYIVYTQDALKKELKRKEESEKKKEEVVEAVAEGGAEGTAPEPEKVRPRGWTSLGSESEVVESRFSPNRPLIVYQASRKRKEFGGPHKFSDRDALDSFLECRPHKDPNFDLKRMEVERGVQAVPEVCETVAQTNWFRRVQSSVQCDAGSMMISALQEEPLSPRISDFLREACSKYVACSSLCLVLLLASIITIVLTHSLQLHAFFSVFFLLFLPQTGLNRHFMKIKPFKFSATISLPWVMMTPSLATRQKTSSRSINPSLTFHTPKTSESQPLTGIPSRKASLQSHAWSPLDLKSELPPRAL